MKTKHIFISGLDINEQLPFTVQDTKTLQENFQEQDRAKKELEKFINILEKKFKENISYIGMDVIGEKAYERFMFQNSGFFEVLVQAPVALSAHFPDQKRAQKFCKALKATLNKILPDTPAKAMFIESLEVKDEKDTSLTVNQWRKVKEIRG